MWYCFDMAAKQSIEKGDEACRELLEHLNADCLEALRVDCGENPKAMARWFSFFPNGWMLTGAMRVLPRAMMISRVLMISAPRCHQQTMRGKDEQIVKAFGELEMALRPASVTVSTCPRRGRSTSSSGDEPATWDAVKALAWPGLLRE
jgi:hypothetical protein